MKSRVLIALLLIAITASAQSVPNPTVTGPIAATGIDSSRNYPFFATTADLAKYGYVEEEYFFAGTANTYNVDPAVLKLDTAVVTGSGFAYKTRMLVRRPASAEAFNGIVVMEWLNVTVGYDIDATWLASYEHMMRKGYAWIGVSAQRVGVHMANTGLKAWSPTRYGTLNIANDNLSWDIFSQAAQAVRQPQGVDPMGGLPVQQVIAVGVSQGATRLSSYYNAIHPLANVFDSFGVFQGGFLLRTDLAAPAMKILTETDVAGNVVAKSQAWIRQPDSEYFRRWEVAGSSHIDYHVIQELNPLAVRDGVTVLSGAGCTTQLPFSRIPTYFVFNAALEHMVDWVKHGVAPPQAPEIEVVTFGEQISVLGRDSNGNVLGGIRLADLAVPTATNTGLNLPGTTACRTFGSYVPYTDTMLTTIYPNHETYLSSVIAAAHENLKDGFILGPAAAATIRQAARSGIGRN